MLIIQSKLVDIFSKKCVGVICINEDTSVSLSLKKANELGVQDIKIIDYLDAQVEDVVVNPRRPNYFSKVDKSVGILDDYKDVPYDRMGDICNKLELKEVINGYVFNYIDFIELDNEIAIKRALIKAEARYKIY